MLDLTMEFERLERVTSCIALVYGIWHVFSASYTIYIGQGEKYVKQIFVSIRHLETNFSRFNFSIVSIVRGEYFRHKYYTHKAQNNKHKWFWDNK